MKDKKDNLKNKNIFLVHKSLVVNNKNYFEFNSEYYSTNIPKKCGDLKIIFKGDLYNKKKLIRDYNINVKSEAILICELFRKFGNNIGMLLEGNFTVVIGSRDSIIFFKDIFGLENLYYLIDKNEKILLISTSIVLMKDYAKFEINSSFFTQYFLLNNNVSTETPYQNILRVNNYTIVRYNYFNDSLTVDNFGEKFFVNIGFKKYSNEEIIFNIRNNLINSISTLTEYYNEYEIINMMSGGIDSSYISVLLSDRNIYNSICASYIGAGNDAEYSEDVAKALDLNHKVLFINETSFLEGIKKSIKASEMPFGFQGESLFYNVFNSYNKNSELFSKKLFLSGQGSDSFFSFGRELRILNYFLKIPFNKINLSKMTKFLPRKYSQITTRLYIDNKNGFVSKELMESYLGVSVFKQNTIQNLLGIDNLEDVTRKEREMVNKTNTTIIKKLHLLHYYYGEIITIPNVLNAIAKSENSKIAFPFLNKNLFDFVTNLDTSVLIKGNAKKYHLRKILAKKIPPKFVYREKISMNIPYLELFKGNSIFKEIINEIINSNYFNFDNKDIFTSEKYSWLWMKLINFHLWKEQFIDKN